VCIAKYTDGAVMDGWWVHGVLSKGLLASADKSEYHGEFEHGKFHGKGFLKYHNGCTYMGLWEVRAGWGGGVAREEKSQRQRQRKSWWQTRAWMLA